MIDRRSMLPLGVAALAAITSGTNARAQAAGGVKITVLYGQPKSPDEFEKYYSGTHMPMVYAVKGIRRVELAKAVPRPDGSMPPFYRITELWFDSSEQMAAVTGTPDWKKVGDDVAKFASGGATILISKVE